MVKIKKKRYVPLVLMKAGQAQLTIPQHHLFSFTKLPKLCSDSSNPDRALEPWDALYYF